MLTFTEIFHQSLAVTPGKKIFYNFFVFQVFSCFLTAISVFNVDRCVSKFHSREMIVLVNKSIFYQLSLFLEDKGKKEVAV